MKPGELCPPTYAMHVDANARPISMWADFSGKPPPGLKRRRMKCPTCGRKLMSSVHLCHDGCCIIHSIPAHKPKGWWRR